jgi:hypothetical protein
MYSSVFTVFTNAGFIEEITAAAVVSFDVDVDTNPDWLYENEIISDAVPPKITTLLNSPVVVNVSPLDVPTNVPNELYAYVSIDESARTEDMAYLPEG